MKSSVRLLLAVVTIATAAPVLASGEKPVSINYAGFGYDTSNEVIEDGMPISLTQADGKGTFGNSSIAITVEFALTQDTIESCPADYPVHGWVVPENYWAVTITFPDLSQVFGFFNEGWICLTEDLRYYTGETHGIYYGGSGRFHGASGEWVSHWEGANLDPTIGFRSIKGDIKGILSLP
jgi:hypothetical protein